MSSVLTVRNLRKYFPVEKSFLDKLLTSQKNFVRAVDDVSFSMNRGDILGLVGESGSGKSTTAKLCLKLIEPTSGTIFFERADLAKLRGEELRRFRRNMQLIFQDPTASLSPRIRVGEAIRHAVSFQGVGTGSEQVEKTKAMLERVGLKPSSSFYDRFPHELSGGQRQRVAIARAISTDSSIIILDEPTSSLDVSIRLQIVHLLMELQKRLGHSYLLIGHDLAMVAYMATDLAVMYLGKIVEFAETRELLRNTLHPYTQALISAALPDHPREKRGRTVLSGEIANPSHIPPGCRFHPRCFHKKSMCSEEEPTLGAAGSNHWVACHLHVT